MLIKSSTALRNEYDNLVKLAKENGEPIYITRNGEGEMVFLPIEDYEKGRRNSSFWKNCFPPNGIA